MPSYSYICKACHHRQNEIRTYEDRKRKAKCGECGGRSSYTISSPVVWDDADTRWVRQHEVEGNGVRSHG